MQKLLSLLARIPAESARFDIIGGVIAVGVVAAVMLFGIPLDQVITLVEAGMAFATVALGRALALTQRRKVAVADTLALAKALAAMRRGEPLPADLAERAAELVGALAPSPEDTVVSGPVLSVVKDDPDGA